MRLTKQRKIIIALIVIITIAVPLAFKFAGVTDDQTTTVLTALASISGLLTGSFLQRSVYKHKNKAPILAQPESIGDEPKP